MIVRSIEVASFRCFDRAIKLSGLAPGLNVIHGPNGAGKSTLLLALRHGLLDSHSLSGAQVKQTMQPWGRALYPRILIVFEQGGMAWRIEKRFLSGASSRLEREENGVFRPVAEGKEADAQLRAMLLADGPQKGAAQEAHLGLLQVLWTPQGPPRLPAWSPAVRSTLQAAFGAALSSKAADNLAGLVNGRFLDYFTPTGQTKKSSPMVQLQQDVSAWQEKALTLKSQWEAAARSREHLGLLRSEIGEKESRAALLKPDVQAAAAHRSRLAEATNAELHSRQAFQTLDTRLSQWRADIETAHQLQRQMEAAGGDHKLANESLAAAAAQRPRIEALAREIEALHLSGLDAKAWPDLLRFRSLAETTTRLRRELSELQAPQDRAIAEIRRLQQQLEIKTAALDASSLKLSLEAESPQTLELAGEKIAIASGEIRELTSPQSISIRLPGIARITAASANPQAAGLELEVSDLGSRLAILLNGETTANLEERYTHSQAIQQKLTEADAELRPLSARRAEFEELASRRLEWTEQTPDIIGIREDWKSRKETLDKAKTEFDLPALAAAHATATAKLEGLTAQFSQINSRLAQHAASGPIGDLEGALRRAQTEAALARAGLQDLLAGAPANLASLESELSQLESSLALDRQTAAHLAGQLAALQTQNLYSRLAEAEERQSETASILGRHRRRAAAILLLKETLESARQNLTSSLPNQIAEEATRNWRRIAGPDAHPIRVSESWHPGGFHVPGAEAGMDEISGGEAEQISFATRLALATQLAQEERQLAVFDDAFLATDPARAENIIGLLAAASGRLQIIVLTCHPSRYATLPGARVFDLEKLKE